MKRILVVEDEASIRELVALNLKMTGWEVLEAPSAERALELIQKNPPCDVALLDIMLPGMDGFSLCETIRHGDPYIGIIMASAKGQESDKIRGLSIGADDYITKPFNAPILLARIANVLKRTAKKDAVDAAKDLLQLEHKGVVLNLSAGTIEHAGKREELTKNELKILHFLYQRPGEIVPRVEIIEYLWDNEAFIDDNTLSVNMTRIRGKLLEIGVEDFIETRRGMGYRI